LKTILRSVLESEVELTENGRRREVLMLEALLMKQVQEGLRGKLDAIESLLDRYERHVGSEVECTEEVPEEDLLLLRRALSRSERDISAYGGGHDACSDPNEGDSGCE
jgi:hypothetical protein